MSLINQLDRIGTALDKLVKGGPGSGNFGHSGRPGQAGGSGGGVGIGGYPGLKAPKMSSKDRATIEAYQENSYEINGWLREGIGNAPEVIQRQAIATKKVFDKYAIITTQPMIVYRGLDSDDLPGEKFQDKAFVSTTTDPKSAAFFGEHIMAIHVPTGTRVLPVLKGSEQEVILPQWKSFTRGKEVGTIERAGHLSTVYEWEMH